MVTTLVLATAVGLAGGQPPRPVLSPPTAEEIPLHKVPGPGFKIPCRVPERKADVAGVELWSSSDGGKTWGRADLLPWSGAETAGRARKDFEFHAPKAGEYWFAARVQFTDGRYDPAEVKQLVPAQRVFVLAGDEPPTPEADISTRTLDGLADALDQIEMVLIRKEMIRLAGAETLTPEVAERLDRLRARVNVLRWQTTKPAPTSVTPQPLPTPEAAPATAAPTTSPFPPPPASPPRPAPVPPS